MKIDNFVINNCNKKDGIWRLDGHEEFLYSDGLHIENYILNIIKNASDITSQSRELEMYIKDWPSEYHLSRKRTLAYQPLGITKEDTVLEVGSGCGSITRYLGEVAKNVLAIEGSLKRAEITRERTRDLKNVGVVCAPFQEIKYKEKFDIIVCNGVFEYSSIFVDGEKPYDDILEIFKKALNPNGRLFLAIENKLGLRYFSSSTEDHNGVQYDGIEGYPRQQKGARTFGYVEINKLLEKHFSNIEVMFPLPDYKLPNTIIREKLIDKIKCSELFARSDSFTHGAAVKPVLHERLAWGEVEKNGMLKDMANSFFCIASNSDSRALADEWLGSVYSIQRKAKYTTETRFIDNFDDSINVEKSHFEKSGNKDINTKLIHDLSVSKWINGESLQIAISKLMCAHQTGLVSNKRQKYIREWWNSVYSSSKNSTNYSIDKIWQNSYIVNGAIKFIDDEWKSAKDVSPQWLLYRTVYNFMSEEVPYIHRWDLKNQFSSNFSLLKNVSAICGVPVSFKDIYFAMKLEKNFQFLITGNSRSIFKMFISFILPMRMRHIWFFLNMHGGRIKKYTDINNYLKKFSSIFN